MEEDKALKVDRLTYSALAEVIESCADEQYLSNAGGLEDLSHAFLKLQSKYPYINHGEIHSIDREDIPTLAKGLEYMINTKDDWDVLQITKSDGQHLIKLLKTNASEIKNTDWLFQPM